ncbi:hypothetical protein HYPBUDRAFT_151623 [Hyphopichia burtonii NRRL Y-1933]|uniref:DUF3533 domain-containing protein n=1 Tax=Hyphopichia burtonii NRRL Y-1933 TaxID=984485 RepID=A0A1E4RT29_9ASCO|nr:hypothetical protein HYPBUDRAFT_151623 [Hyphopichia burtonii NRRL Y-1933]ODV70205.1 hypothetical protein HYPBUDRAFT_151623 [Hyphopichia burtonii NRRL Y-1933]
MNRSNSRDSSSLASSVDSEEIEARPVQLDESNVQPPLRRQSLVRRISSSATNYFADSHSSRHRSNLIASSRNFKARKLSSQENDPMNIYYDELDSDFLFGHDQIGKSFSRVPDEEEEAESLGSTDDQATQEEFPRIYEGFGERRESSFTEDEINRQQSRTSRRNTIASTIQSVTRKLGFWDKDFHQHRINIVITYLKNYAFLIVGLVVTLCIYWGTFYERTGRFHDLHFAVINADRQVGSLPGAIGEVVEYFFVNVTQVQSLGTFEIIDFDTINKAALDHNNSITEEVYHQIHIQKYWAAYYIKENSTLRMYEALKTASDLVSPSDSFMEVVYETGRNYNAVNNYVKSIVGRTKLAFDSFIPQTPYLKSLLGQLNSTEIENVLTNAPNLVTTNPSFVNVDRLPVNNPVVQAPFQIGLVYLMLFSFFQFVFLIQIHTLIAQRIKGFKYLLYRMAASHSSYVVLSLAYVVLNAAFGITFTTTFGYLGFLVVWAFAYLTMASSGALMEALALVIFMLKPQLIGFLIVFMVVINLAPTVSPIVLCPNFYRYGYAMPIYNSYELMHVPYFNAYKGHMGRNIGILIAWIVISTLTMVIIMARIGKKMKAAEERSAQEKADQEKDKATQDETSREVAQDEALGKNNEVNDHH